MKKFEFNHEGKRWDRYHQFHTRNYPWVEFESGALLLDATYVRPHHRHFYERYGVELVCTNDIAPAKFNAYTPDGERVKKSWLGRNARGRGWNRLYLIDHERGKMFAPLGHSEQKRAGMPDRLWGGFYFPNAESDPLHGEVTLYKPYAHTKESRAAISEFNRIAKAMWALESCPHTLRWHVDPLVHTLRQRVLESMEPQEVAASVHTRLLYQYAEYVGTVAPVYTNQVVDHLVIKSGE